MISNFHSTLLGFVYIDKMSLSRKEIAKKWRSNIMWQKVRAKKNWVGF